METKYLTNKLRKFMIIYGQTVIFVNKIILKLLGKKL
jgi:hypothetical protein